MDSAVPRGPDRRKEWRAVPQESDHGKHGHSDERTIYEEGAGPLQVDYCSITIDGGDDMLRERLQEIARQQQELHQMEVGLRAHAMARSEFAGMQNEYEARVKEHADAAAALKEQLHEREQQLRDMGAKLDEKDRELRAVKIDNEAAWAKEDLLREQNKELATYRRERDNSEAERAQHLQKIHELQEHVQEKESQFLALEEQHRVAQETILFKDEQLREAQAWIARAQEMDALHSTTNQTLQAELRDRTEQFNQYWIGLQRQFAEVERHHLQAIQQLQLELAEAREHHGVYKEGSHVTRDKGSPVNVNGSAVSNGNLCFMSNGNAEAAPSFVSATSASTKAEHVSAVSVPSSVLGVGTFLPPGQMTAVHPVAMHTQGTRPVVPLATNPPNPQSHMAHHLPVSALLPVQHWSNEQALPDASQAIDQIKHLPSQTEQHHLRSNVQHSYPNSAERQVEHSENPKTSINTQIQRSGPVISSSNDGVQVLESTGDQYQQVTLESHDTSKAKSQPQASLVCNLPKQKSDPKVQDENLAAASNQAQEKVFPSGQQQAAVSIAASTAESHPVSSLKVADHDDIKQISAAPGKTVEPTLLDERSLLACIVRAIPAGSDGRIRISSTLPNRLGKMLAPLHWHDYKKFYGKLDDFVALHLELFVIEGDFIHLREGAQEIISATTAYAKVAAAAASSAPYPSLLPSVAVTPVAQSNRHKKAQPADSMSASTVLPTESTSVLAPGTSHVRRSHNVKMHNQQATNSVQTKDLQEPNGLAQMKSGPASLHKSLGNGSNLDNGRDATGPVLSFGAMPPSQSNGMTNGRQGFGGRQQGRSSAAGLISRRQN